MNIKTNKIFVKTKKKKGKALLSVGFNYKGEAFQVSSKIQVPVECWDGERIVNVGSFKSAARNNEDLAKYKANMTKLMERYFRYSTVPTKSKFKYDWQNLHNYRGEIGDVAYEIGRFVENFKAEGRKSSYIQKYDDLHFHVKKYEEQKKVKTHISEVNRAWMSGFTGYLVRKNYVDTTIRSHIKNLKGIFKGMQADGLAFEKSVLDYECPYENYVSSEPIITEDEFWRILNLSLEPKDDIVRVVFLIGCCTGLRFSDILRLSQSDIFNETSQGQERTLLKFRAQKTGAFIGQDITHDDVLLSLLERKFQFDCSKFPTAHFRRLKSICQKANLNEMFSSFTIKAGNQIYFEKPKWDFITMHSGRRSYITKHYAEGSNELDIMRLTGIKSYATLCTYIKATEGDHVNRVLNRSIPNNPYTSGQHKLEVGKAS
jgi:integrase